MVHIEQHLKWFNPSVRLIVVTNIQRDRDTDNATSSYYYIPLFLLGAINKLKFYLQFK